MNSNTQLHAAYKTPLEDQTSRSVMGPIAMFLATSDQTSGQFSLLNTIVPPGVIAPLHSHPGVECFYILEGHLQVLAYHDEQSEWLDLAAGDSVVVPSGARHAIRNISRSAVRALLVTNAELGRFFEEIATPVGPDFVPGPPTAKAVSNFVETAARYGYWLGSPEENRRIGLEV